MIVASVLACVSPSVAWTDNRRMTIALLRDASTWTYRNRKGNVVKLGGYGANIAKARLIIKHNDPTVLSGPKVIAFRDAILGMRDYAVIDRHATNIAMGTVDVFDGPDRFIPNIALAYEHVALAVGWQVNEVQAATWVIYKNRKAS